MNVLSENCFNQSLKLAPGQFSQFSSFSHQLAAKSLGRERERERIIKMRGGGGGGGGGGGRCK